MLLLKIPSLPHCKKSTSLSPKHLKQRILPRNCKLFQILQFHWSPKSFRKWIYSKTSTPNDILDFCEVIYLNHKQCKASNFLSYPFTRLISRSFAYICPSIACFFLMFALVLTFLVSRIANSDLIYKD